MKIGVMELLVIFVIALVVLGPDKLPEYAKKFGIAMREFRKASADITKDIKEGVVEPLEEMQRPLAEAVAPINEMSQQIENDLKEVQTSINNVGKVKPAPAQKPAVQEEAPTEPAQEAPAQEEPAQETEIKEN